MDWNEAEELVEEAVTCVTVESYATVSSVRPIPLDSVPLLLLSSPIPPARFYFSVVVLYMAPKQPCAKYQYVVTASGPKILPVDEPASKDEESPAEYNTGGYLAIKVNDTFNNNRYKIVRKLGWVFIFKLRALAGLI